MKLDCEIEDIVEIKKICSKNYDTNVILICFTVC